MSYSFRRYYDDEIDNTKHTNCVTCKEFLFLKGDSDFYSVAMYLDGDYLKLYPHCSTRCENHCKDLLEENLFFGTYGDEVK